MSFLGTDGNKKMEKKKNKIIVSDWKVWKKRCNQKKDTTLKGKGHKNNYYEKLSELPLDKISNTYSKIVLGYLLKFFSEYSEKSIKTFRESVQIYTPLPPSLVGRLGCHWMNEDVIAWF